MVTGSFLGLFWGRMSAPSQSKNEQKLPKEVNNSPNFRSCTVWWKFHEYPTKNSKVTDVYIHTLMHIFKSNYKGQCNYTDIYYGFKSDNLKWRSSSFRPNLIFSILMAQMVISQIQQAPGPNIGREIPELNSKIYYFPFKRAIPGNYEKRQSRVSILVFFTSFNIVSLNFHGDF